MQQIIKSFHDEEDGLDSIQAVLILAIAAVALLAVKASWETIAIWFKDLSKEFLR